MSLIYPLLKKHSKIAEEDSTTASILKTSSHGHMADINFLSAYAHFSMLMPQIHRDTLVVTEASENKFKLDFPSEAIRDSEIIDKLYCTLTLPVSFKNDSGLQEYTNRKAQNRDNSITESDLVIIKSVFEHHLQNSVNIEVLPNEVLTGHLGFSVEDCAKFSASLKAFSDFFICLARSYNQLANDISSDKEKEGLMAEYFEWSVCCLKYQFLGCFLAISEVSKSSFENLLSYFIDEYSNKTGINFHSNSFVGEGFLPPITLIGSSILFSPLALRYLLSFNNILYSINKTQKKLFDNEVSRELEPTLINQAVYLFSKFPELKSRKNVSYPGGEIDLLVLSESEEVCLSIQVKCTITPDSSRTVARVQQRVTEAMNQIETFEKMDSKEQTNLINTAFETNKQSLRVINLILVRSSAGSSQGWEVNEKYRIVNYPILSMLLCRKLNEKSFYISDIDNEILEQQRHLIAESNWTVTYETLQIGKYEIDFPNIEFDSIKVLFGFLKSFKCFPKLEHSTFV